MKAADAITVVLDGQPHRLPAGTTLAGLVALLGHAPAGVGTAITLRTAVAPMRTPGEPALAGD